MRACVRALGASKLQVPRVRGSGQGSATDGRPQVSGASVGRRPELQTSRPRGKSNSMVLEYSLKYNSSHRKPCHATHHKECNSSHRNIQLIASSHRKSAAQHTETCSSDRKHCSSSRRKMSAHLTGNMKLNSQTHATTLFSNSTGTSFIKNIHSC